MRCTQRKRKNEQDQGAFVLKSSPQYRSYTILGERFLGFDQNIFFSVVHILFSVNSLHG